MSIESPAQNRSAINTSALLVPETGAPWSHTFIDLPAGEYTVIETATGGATHVSVSPSATTVVTADSDTAVTVTNAFVGTLTLTKQTDIPTGKTFGFDINCAFNGTNVNGWTNPIKLTAGRSYTTPEIPAGALCSVTESDTGNPISTLIELDSLGVQSQTVGTQASGLGITNGADTKVGFFNSFAQGSTIATSTTTAIAPSTTSIAATSTTLGNTIGSLGSTPPSIDDDNNLATTGSDADQLFTIGGAAILGGGALIFGTRRRRKTRADS